MPMWLTVVITVFDLIIAAAAVWGIGKKVEKRILEKHDEDKQRDADIAEALNGVRAMPGYRQQSLNVQSELQETDKAILETCAAIQSVVAENQKILVERLDRLEEREKNALRAKIIDMYRLFTSKQKNPMQAWTDMEKTAFDKLVEDYESLHGNDYVHSTVIPEMNRLDVIPIANKKAVEELFHSRQA